MLKVIEDIVVDKKRRGFSRVLIINYLKEYLQYLILNLLYNHSQFNRELVFKGGSCLRIIYQLPRLSEDLDFDIRSKQPDIILSELSDFLVKQITQKYLLPVETKIQSSIRLYLKFPILRQLGLTPKGESNKLYIKIEISPTIIPKAEFNLVPISKFNFNFVVSSYNLSTLMVGKLNAFFNRIWFRGKDNQIVIKGRDFYDLYWFLSQHTTPNWPALQATMNINNWEQLKAKINQRLAKVNSQQIGYDLKNFIDDQEFISQFSENYKDIIARLLDTSS